MSAGTPFDFDGVLPVEVHALTLEEAERLWAEHQARCPGSYLECWDTGRAAERERWILEGMDLEAQLNVARAFHDSPMARQPGPKTRAQRQANSVYHPSRRTTQDYIAELERELAIMATLKVGSPEWQRHRDRAGHVRHSATRRAVQDGYRGIIPVIPRRREGRGGAEPDPRLP